VSQPAAPPDEDVARLAHDLRIACMRVSRRVRFESTSDVAPHQFSVLVRLLDHPSTLRDLAAFERVSPPSMSRTITGLVEQGLVAKADDPDDGRAVALSLTVEGRRVVDTARAQRDAWMAARLEDLTAAERKVLTRATRILEEVLAQ
jgi:DNA-binding MarR family transcriptional regulator